MNSQVLEQETALGDQDEIDRLEQRARQHLGSRVRDFRLLFHDTGLILQGTASTYHAKQLAQHSIMEETRLPILANEIEVAPFCYEPG